MHIRKRMIFVTLAAVMVCFTVSSVTLAQTSKMNSQLKSKILSAPRDISKLDACVKDAKQCPQQTISAAKTTDPVTSETFQNGTPTAKVQSNITTRQTTNVSKRQLSITDSNEKYQPYVQKGQNAVTGGK